jgi:hypothetical protein
MNNAKNNKKKIADALNECLESVLNGNETVDSCLKRYPQYSEEFKPLLETMEAARAVSNFVPDPSFRASARREFRNALYDNTSRKARPGLAWRWATIASTMGVFLLTSAGGAVAASSSSMPGQPLYQLKRNIEDVQMTLTTSQADKARFYAVMADRRISEIVYTAQSGDVKRTEDLTQQFSNDLSMVSAIAEPARATTFGGSSKQSGAPASETSTNDQTTPTATNNSIGVTDGATSQSTSAPFTTVTPSVTSAVGPIPTVIVTSPPLFTPAMSAIAPSVTLTQAQPQVSLSGITDPALLTLLQQYSVKNLAELMSILDKVPPSSKEALSAAIQVAASAYGQILGS